MKWIGSRSRTPIGVDVAGRALRAVQLTRSEATWRVAGAASVRRAHPDAEAIDAGEAARFRDVLRRQGFTGSEVVLAVPSAKLLTGVLELPPRTSGAPVEEIARAELARMHDRAPGSFEMSCWDLPAPARAKKGTPVMVAACGHGDADAYLDVFEQGGFRVVALDAEVCALARAFRPVLGGGTGIAAGLELGWGSVLLVLLYGGVVVYQRVLAESGVGRLHEALTEQLGLDGEVADYALEGVGLGRTQRSADWQVRADVQAKIAAHFSRIVDELRISLSYAVHQYPDAAVDRMLVVGEGAMIPGLADYLRPIVSAEVRTVGLSDLADCPPELPVQPGAAEMVKALGLARFLDE